MESPLPLFVISNDDDMSSLTKPFSRSDLLLAIEEFFQRLEKKEKFKEEHFETLTLEQKIEVLTKEYTSKLLHLMQNEK
jgi:FixJ family two-component response regulator